MRILLDENAPRVIRERLASLAIDTVQDMGWTGKKNGHLLDLAEEQFEVFVTADKNLPHQQNLSRRKLAVIILPSNQVPAVLSAIPALEQAILSASCGQVILIPSE